MKKLVYVLLSLFALNSVAEAQSVGKLKAWNVWGNPTASSNYGVSTTFSALFDGQFTCSGRGSIIERGASAWSCFAPGATGLPLVSNGTGADIAYQNLGIVGGGTGRGTLTTHGVLIGEGTSAINQTAVGGTNFPFIGQTGADPIWSTISYPGSANSGGVACFTAATTMVSSVALTANAIMIGGGAGVCPTSLGLGTTTTVLHGNASGLPSYTSIVFGDISAAALATQAQYIAGTANTLVASNIAYTTETTTTFGATTTFDFSTFINTAVTLTGNITTQTLTTPKAGQAGQIRFIQDGTGSRTTVWNSIFKFTGGVTPSLSTAAGSIDVLFYSCVSSTLCYAGLNQNMK